MPRAANMPCHRCRRPAPANCLYCRSCRAEKDRERHERKLAKRRTGAPRGRAPRAWRCLFDPDHDFTGKTFSAIEGQAMIAHGSFSRGAILITGAGEWTVVGRRG